MHFGPSELYSTGYYVVECYYILALWYCGYGKFPVTRTEYHDATTVAV